MAVLALLALALLHVAAGAASPSSRLSQGSRETIFQGRPLPRLPPAPPHRRKTLPSGAPSLPSSASMVGELARASRPESRKGCPASEDVTTTVAPATAAPALPADMDFWRAFVKEFAVDAEGMDTQPPEARSLTDWLTGFRCGDDAAPAGADGGDRGLAQDDEDGEPRSAQLGGQSRPVARLREEVRRRPRG